MKTKIISGYLFISVLILLVTTVALYGFNQMRTSYEEIIDDSDATVIALREIQYYFTGQANDERGFLLAGNPEFRTEIQEKSEQVKQRINKLKPLMDLQTEKDLLDQLDQAHTAFTTLNLQVIDLYQQGKTQEAHQLSFNEGRKIRKGLETSFNQLFKIQEEQIIASRSAADTHSRHTQMIVFITSIFMVVLGIIFGVLLSRNIVKPITRITEDMKNGNLNFAAMATTKDEVGILTTEFGNMVTRLREMVLGVQGTADQVAASSEQLTAGAEQSAQAASQIAEAITGVASGAEDQLSFVDHAKTTVDQMDLSIRQVTLKTDQVLDSSNRTADAANNGLGIVETVINQMSHIDQTVNHSATVVVKLGERSNEIGQITDTISALASQTNLLALNAAIEAARAGEQGKGFAVVAEEVRKLAEQSQDASQKIADLIGEIQSETNRAVVAMHEGTNEVQAGTEIVASARQSFNQISTLVHEVCGQVNEIAASMQKLADSSQQIVTSMGKVENIAKDTVGRTQTVSASTEEQSASVEEIAASSQTLAKMAGQLQDIISAFKV